MAVYVFQCCGRAVSVPDDSTSPVSLQHLCLNDVPCIGMAFAAAVGSNATTVDPSTIVVDPMIPTQLDGADGGMPNNGDGQ